MQQRKKKKRYPKEWIEIVLLSCILLSVAGEVFWFEGGSEDLESISIDWYFDTLIEGEPFSFYLLAYDGNAYEWDNYEVVFDGFTATETPAYKDDNFVAFHYSNISDIGGDTKKTITFTLYEGHEDAPVTLTIHFNLHTAGWLFRCSLAIECLLIVGLLALAIIRFKDRLAKKVLLITYSVIGLAVYARLIKLNLNVNLSVMTYIILCCGFVFYILLTVLVSKKMFRIFGYTVIIILASTYLLYQLSYFFTYYYSEVYSLWANEEWYSTYAPLYYSFSSAEFDFVPYLLNKFWWTTKENIKFGTYSFRYFFTFPDESVYGVAAIFQFMLGKLYDLVVFGSVANCIINVAKPKKQKE